MKIQWGGFCFSLWFPRKYVCIFFWGPDRGPVSYLHNGTAFSGQPLNFACIGNKKAHWHSTFPEASTECAWTAMFQLDDRTSTEDASSGLPLLPTLLGQYHVQAACLAQATDCVALKQCQAGSQSLTLKRVLQWLVQWTDGHHCMSLAGCYSIVRDQHCFLNQTNVGKMNLGG